MRNYIFSLLLLLPLLASAHGGVEKSADSVIVYLNQIPLSPLIGEKVFMTFSLVEKNNLLFPVRNLPVRVTIKDTYPDNALRDTIIEDQDMKTDVNGVIRFGYTFKKENYFDVDLSFDDPVTGERQTVGFLVQPRNSTIISTSTPPAEITSNDFGWPKAAFILFAGFLFGLIVQRLIRNRS